MVCAFAVAGCSNKTAKAQALLLEAIDYSAGTAGPSRDRAIKFAASKGFGETDKPGSLTEQELVLIAAREKCKEILTLFPTTPAAIRAAELKSDLDRQLRSLANERIKSLYVDPYQ